MNKAIFTGLAGATAFYSVSAQGTLGLSTATGTKPRITIGGVNATVADNIWVQVLVAGATSLTGTDTFQWALNPAGLFSKGTLTVNGIPGGTAVDVTIRG